MALLLGCVADDFTGATDLAGMLVKYGMRTVQLIGVPQPAPPPDVDAIVVALKTRSCPAEEAVRDSIAALCWLQKAGCRQFYFKYCSTFDSTPRGNIGPVAEALMDALGTDFTIACPAFPANRRTIYQGYLFAGIPWWKEPTKDQWYAFVAAWLGWTLDAFDFTVFLLIMHPIAETFHVSMTAVTFVFTITLWMRLIGATASGWLGDRFGRKKPLMIAILGYSACNFIAGFSPTFLFLFTARAVLGLFMGAEWPAGASLAMETWPLRSRGFMSGLLQGSWGLGFLLSFAIYGLFFNSIGWRGMLWVGVLPALAVLYIRFFVKEPEVWVENRRLQRTQQREVRAPLVSIFRRGMILNTLNCCWFMASGFVLYYSINVLFPTHLQVDLKMSPGAIGEIGVAANLVVFLASMGWGWVADRFGRKAAQILPALIAIPIAPLYLLTSNFTLIWWAFVIQGAFGSGGFASQAPSYLSERFPTEVRATAAGFCYHQGAIWGGLVAPILAYVATAYHIGYAIPMLVGTIFAAASFAIAIALGPETRGKELSAELVVA